MSNEELMQKVEQTLPDDMFPASKEEVTSRLEQAGIETDFFESIPEGETIRDKGEVVDLLSEEHGGSGGSEYRDIDETF